MLRLAILLYRRNRNATENMNVSKIFFWSCLNEPKTQSLRVRKAYIFLGTSLRSQAAGLRAKKEGHLLSDSPSFQKELLKAFKREILLYCGFGDQKQRGCPRKQRCRITTCPSQIDAATDCVYPAGKNSSFVHLMKEERLPHLPYEREGECSFYLVSGAIEEPYGTRSIK